MGVSSVCVEEGHRERTCVRLSSVCVGVSSVCVEEGHRERTCVRLSSVCVEEGERRSEEELGARRRSVGRSVVGRSSVVGGGSSPKSKNPTQ